jgi:phosphoglucomutase
VEVITRDGWFAVRPPGTEAVYKIYAESFRDEQHLQAILTDARQIVGSSWVKAAISSR